MKILYLDCSMGAAGDMLTASLAELLDDPAAFVGELNSIGIPDVVFTLTPAEKRCPDGSYAAGSQVHVSVGGTEEHTLLSRRIRRSHSTLGSVSDIIGSLKVSDAVKENALAVYRLIADAEGKVHGKSAELVHFHEVGALDAVADITAVCMLIERIAPDEIYCSPLATGSGTVKCAHGVLPVPAPAVAELIKDMPNYPGDIKGELLTPTGAALICRFVTEFRDMPNMERTVVGTGIGVKDFQRPNCLKSYLGYCRIVRDSITELSCNIDDMTGEELGFALEVFMASGALDAFFTPIYMKKNRPAYMLTVLSAADAADSMAELIFKHTTTLGIRRRPCERYILERSFSSASTPFGQVRVKNGKPEYDDLARLARENGMSIREIKNML